MNIRIGARLIDEKPINTYVIHCKNMSGDSDHYETTTIHIDYSGKGMDIVKHIHNLIRLYSIPWLMSENDRNEKRLLVKKIIETGEKYGIEDPIDTYADMVGYDVTCDDMFAMPDLLWITFFNYCGNEFMVEITNDNKVFMGGINEGNIKEIFDES